MIRRELLWILFLFLFTVGCFVICGCSAQNEKSSQPPKKDDSVLDLGNGVTMKLVLIPAGEFTMGSPESEQSWAMAQGKVERRSDYSDEGPQHKVKISKPFYMGAYEVTLEQWTAVMGTTVGQQIKNFLPGADFTLSDEVKHSDCPMFFASWDDAVEFCKKVSEETGRNVHLPTEAQWEYACRAGRATWFYFGDDYEKLGDYAWYDKNSSMHVHPVGQKKPNAWGLYDMYGNVLEWCSDWYHETSYTRSEYMDPTGPGDDSLHRRDLRVLRGGCYDYPWQLCRSASRDMFTPSIGPFVYGFRVVVDPPVAK